MRRLLRLIALTRSKLVPDYQTPVTITNTDDETSGNNIALDIVEHVNPASNSTGNYFAIRTSTQNDNNNNNVGGMQGMTFDVVKTGSGSVTSLLGVNGLSRQAGSGAATAQSAVSGQCNCNGPTTQCEEIAAALVVQASGNITNSYGLRTRVASFAAGGAVGTREGVSIPNQGNAGITTSYALRINAQSASGTVWSIVSEGGQSELRSGAVGQVPLTVKGIAGQTALIFRVQTSASANVFEVGQNAIGFFGTAAVAKQVGASAAGIAAITDANAKAAIQALQTALANLGLVTSPA